MNTISALSAVRRVRLRRVATAGIVSSRSAILLSPFGARMAQIIMYR